MLGSSHGIWPVITNYNQDTNYNQNTNLDTNYNQQRNSDAANHEAGSNLLKPYSNWSNQIHRNLVSGFTKMVTDRIQNGWSCHLLTILFSQLPGRRDLVLNQMKDEVQRIYSTFVTRVHRNPRDVSACQLPMLLGSADLPVHKRDRKQHLSYAVMMVFTVTRYS
jgi:hypothetical protein